MKSVFSFFVILLGVTCHAFGQENNLRCKNLFPSSDTIVLDTLPLSVLNLTNEKLKFIPPNKIVFINTTSKDSILVCYRVLLPSRFKIKYGLRNPLENSDNPKVIAPMVKTVKNKLAQDQIFTNGSVSRGLSSGNNQGFLINSDLNLQMQGNLGKGVRLTAAVSDNNSPLQPDGTTLQIQDFDRVFVKIDKDSWFGVAGDYFMNSQKDNHFLAFNKKSRGLQFEGVFKSAYFDRITNQTHAAVSRGRFSRNEIQGIEGIQGPYRLQGAQNEAFVIVLAATEVVYVDGKKLTRGEQNDYVVNYNSAEILFNPNILITQYSRIVIEFQYADQNYSRILFNQHLGLERKKTKVTMNYFLEQDNKNQPFQAENTLSLFDSINNAGARSILASSGDDKSAAVIGTARREESFSDNKILYYQKDTSGFSNALIYEPIERVGFEYFTATFSNVGQGNGNYIQINPSANGRVYAWVQPVGGVPQGDFEPVVQLAAPVRQQMATLAVEHNINANTKVKTEFAYSQLNNNTFSNLDKADDDALGTFIEFSKLNQFRNKVTWQNKVYLERISKGFAYIERYRNVEFDRKWNRSLINPVSERVQETELIANLSGKVGGENNWYSYDLSSYSIKDIFSGFSPTLGLSQKLGKRNRLNANVNWMDSKNKDSLKTQAYNAELSNSFSFTKLTSLTVFGKAESNQPLLLNNDSLNGRAFQYQRYGLQFSSKLKKLWSISLGAEMRTDQRAENKKFLWASDGLNINTQISRTKGVKRVALISNLRFLTQNQQFFAQQKEQFLQQRIEFADNNFKKGYSANFYLQSGTGREQKREFVYIEVPAGQGQYAWNDYNGNGVKEINEFEVSVFIDQAKFIKIYNLTNEFVNANQHEGNISLRLLPGSWFKKSAFLSNVSNQFNLRVVQRNNSNNLLIMNPFQQDTQILSGNSLLRNTVLYNSSKLGVEITAKSTSVKQLLTYGNEANQRMDYIAKSRYNLGKNWQFDAGFENSNLLLDNAFFSNRNYNWDNNSGDATVSWQNLKTRISLKGGVTAGSGDEGAITGLKLNRQELKAIYFYNMNTNTNIDISASQSKITFNGQSNSPLGFQILNGLSQGNNYQWTVNLRTLISDNIQISFGYEGRNIPLIKTVHIGRAEARYLF